MEFIVRLEQILKERGIKKAQFEADTGISRRIFYGGERMVRKSTLMAIAYYLGIYVEKLIEGTDAEDVWYT